MPFSLGQGNISQGSKGHEYGRPFHPTAVEIAAEEAGVFIAMNDRTLDALRSLAERPGTEQEGIVAREKLAALEAKRVGQESANRPLHFYESIPTHFTCPCGMIVPCGSECGSKVRHDSIRKAMRVLFPKGARIYYNYWSGSVNTVGIVVDYPRPTSYNWGWIRIQFEHLKSVRNVPVFSGKGWYISTMPLSPEEAYKWQHCWGY